MFHNVLERTNRVVSLAYHYTNGLRTVRMKCNWRKCNNEVVGGRKQKFCSRLCGIKQSTVEKRVRFKKRAVEMFGGRCSRCGYDKCLRALEFHHINPESKEFGMSDFGNKSWHKVEIELAKCELLCSNCHAEVEDFQLRGRLVAMSGVS